MILLELLWMPFRGDPRESATDAVCKKLSKVEIILALGGWLTTDRKGYRQREPRWKFYADFST